MEVTGLRDRYRERGHRERRWFSIDEAVGIVGREPLRWLVGELPRWVADDENASEIAGGPSPDDPSLFEEVRRAAQALPNVRFLGPVPFHDVRRLFERARMLVGTSEIEGVPNTYLQAWGHGTPVVAYLDPEHLISENRLGKSCTRRTRWHPPSPRSWRRAHVGADQCALPRVRRNSRG